MTEQSTGADRIQRHALIDRLLHWLFAASILFLLGTGFLPILGIQFEWVTLHWGAGLLLLVFLAVHMWRAWIKTQFRKIWFGLTDARLALSGNEKPGKYSPAQKMMHFGVTVMVLATLVTGLIMMVKVDTPFWERNPYLLDSEVWGVIYVVHGFAALFLITTVMLHIYFAVRPEKLMYLRAMFGGNMSKDELEKNHDTAKWSGDE